MCFKPEIKNIKDFNNLFIKSNYNSIIFLYIYDKQDIQFENKLHTILQKPILRGLQYAQLNINTSKQLINKLDINICPGIRVYSNNSFLDFIANDFNIIPLIEKYLNNILL
tara:strand:+ start:791 stop:1123 length:333 start_codon:yes stop_codon:yes gene_type:complete